MFTPRLRDHLSSFLLPWRNLARPRFPTCNDQDLHVGSASHCRWSSPVRRPPPPRPLRRLGPIRRQVQSRFSPRATESSPPDSLASRSRCFHSTSTSRVSSRIPEHKPITSFITQRLGSS